MFCLILKSYNTKPQGHIICYRITENWIADIQQIEILLLRLKKHVSKSAQNVQMLTLNIGARTAAPASPYSKAVINWGRILCWHTCCGKWSRCGVRALKNLFFSLRSLICISSRNSSASTSSFLKKPPFLRPLVITSAGLGRVLGFAPTSSQYSPLNDLGTWRQTLVFVHFILEFKQN